MVATVPEPCIQEDDVALLSQVNWTFTDYRGGTVLGTSTISYDAVQGVRISRDPIGEEGGLNLYGYVYNNPINLWDPTGLAWESTPTQGLHYNDRGSKFGFGVGVDNNGRVVPVPLGGNHTFDEGKARGILDGALADPEMRKQLREQNARDFDNPAYRDKNRCQRLGRGLRLAGIFGALLGAASTSLADDARAYVNAQTYEEQSAAAANVADAAAAMGVAPLGSAIIYGQLMK